MIYLDYPNSSVLQIITYRARQRVRTSLLYWYEKLRFYEKYRQLRRLKGSAKGRNAFVFANGPSVDGLDPYKVRRIGYDIFAVNGYLWSEFSKIAAPTHYVLSDPACFYAPDNKRRTDKQIEISKRYTALIKEIETLGATLFVPMRFIHLLRIRNLFGFCDVENEFSSNVVNVERPRGYMTMTAYKALAISLYLGYEKVFICGMDNDYFKQLEADADNRLYYNDRHFFGEGKKTSTGVDGDTVGEFLYTHHFLFSNFAKFPKERIVNLHKHSLNTYFTKEHALDVYKK
jgi:hypothetical protein